MYQVENSGDLIKNKRQLLSRANLSGVGLTVFLLGLTSFLTDISAEMVSTTLPIYLLVTLQYTPFQVGLIDGVYQGAAVLDLETMTETALPGTNNINDQAEWLDNDHILYGMPNTYLPTAQRVSVLPSDGSAEPTTFLETAASPAVIPVVN